MSYEHTPQVGDIWREVDPRFMRYVRIMRTPDPDDLRVSIKSVVKPGDEWIDGKLASVQSAKRERFHGRRGGYELHERPAGS